MTEDQLEFIGTVTRFFDRISVAVVRLEQDLYLEDWVLFYGPHTELEQEVRSMQLNHEAIDRGVAGEEIAVKTDAPVREGDEVYLIMEEEE